MVEPFYNGQARVERFDGGLEIIDETGMTVQELRPARTSEFARLSATWSAFGARKLYVPPWNWA